MNSDFNPTPREELEARLTALLLGELPEADAEALRQQLAADPDLARFHAELARTISLVQESQSLAAQVNLSSPRREKLLEGFKLIQPAELATPAPKFSAWKTWGMLAAMAAFLFAMIDEMLPPMVKARSSFQRTHHTIASSAANEEESGPIPGTPASPPSSGPSTAAPLSAARYFRSEGASSAKNGAAESPRSLARGRSQVVLPQFFEAGQSPANAETPVDAWAAPSDGGLGGAIGAINPRPVLANSGQVNPEAAAPADSDAFFGFAATATPARPAQPNPADLANGRFAGETSLRFSPQAQNTPEKPVSLGVSLYSIDPLATSLASEARTGRKREMDSKEKSLESAPSPAPELKSLAKQVRLQAPTLEPDAASPANSSVRDERKLAEQPAPLAALPELNVAQDFVRSRIEVLADHEVESAGKTASVEDLSLQRQNAGEEMAGRLARPQNVPAAQTNSQIEFADSLTRAKDTLLEAPVPQPETLTAENPFSTFSLNVSDVSFQLAAASLDQGLMPSAATLRAEEFINAFDYRDPEPVGAPIAFAWERAHYPFAHGRDILRLSVKTASAGRPPGRPLNLVLLLDNSGSMERSDRVRIIQECLRVLAAQLQPADRVSVVAFARTARLAVDGLPGSQAAELPAQVGHLSPEGGTNLEEAMDVAYQTARKHFIPAGVNRVVLLTDGAANLGDVQPATLKQKVEAHRRQGIALDCFGIGWDGLNDDLLENLSRNGDGRYGFVNSPEEAAAGFAAQLAGALQVAASDVKVQVEFNPRRVSAHRQVGYAKHQLTKEQFRDNTVDAAEIGAAEAGNAVYIVQTNPSGEGALGTVRVRFRIPGTDDYREHAWPLHYDGAAAPLAQSAPALRLAAVASAFSEWLAGSPHAAEVTTDQLLRLLSGVPASQPSDPRPKKLESMIRQAKSISGK